MTMSDLVQHDQVLAGVAQEDRLKLEWAVASLQT